MINNVKEKAYAKLNLSLDIIRKMSDDYHEMKMILQSVSLCDDITVSKTAQQGITLYSNAPYLPKNSSNIAYKAAELFFDECGIDDYGITIDLFKRIPTCAGMAGGSSDGAAVLRALNKMYDGILPPISLINICKKLGSDVSFCLCGGTSLATGRGEILTDLTPLDNCHIVISKPQFSISTPELFKNVNVKKIRLRPQTDEIILALNNHDCVSVARRMYNVFEDVLQKGRESIWDIKSIMIENGALGATMTGTGSAVFGIFDDFENSQVAFRELSGKYPETFYAMPVPKLRIDN